MKFANIYITNNVQQIAAVVLAEKSTNTYIYEGLFYGENYKI
jgi:hypothetical protein